VVKRWFYQQHIRSATSSFVSQNLPKTLQDVIELAHRFEDTNPKSSETPQIKKADDKPVPDKKGRPRNRPRDASSTTDAKPAQDQKPSVICHRCQKPGHIAPNCPDKQGKSGFPKNE
jgi:hypothetical protein